MGSKKLAIIFFVCVILAFVAGMQYQSLEAPQTPETNSDTMFEYITQTFKDYYLYEISADEIDAAFISQMEAVINTYGKLNDDPYTRLVSQSIYAMPTDQEKFVGIGLQYQFEENDLRVTNVYYQGAAAKKIYPNDLIVGIEINQQKIYFKDLENSLVVTSYLSGDLGEEKAFIVEDPDGNERITVITYQEILTPTAYALDLNETNIGYININQFSGYQEGITEGTSKVFNDALLTLEDTILDGENSNQTLIVDLRNNPGGALTALSNQGFSGLIPGIVQQLLVKTDVPAFSLIDKSGNQTLYYGGLSQEKAYNIVILVNEGSASASEVLAAALSENGGYKLYGEATFGKGVYQNTRFLERINDVNYSLTYTEGQWFYGNQKNVSTDPLEVILIENQGIKSIGVPVYQGALSFDDVSPSLIPFQEFLNLYGEGDLNLRIDGYFDQATEDAIFQFQTDYNLTISGDLDLETAQKIYDLYLEFYHDYQYDEQLLSLIEIIKG
ncbi:MAG: S41 family peptidase [Acholeplasmataceae bacterium]|nr:peptidoglycan-binding protein [Acholeplasmataceae bacterium]